MNEQNAIDRINALTEAQRNEAIDAARKRIVGERPEPLPEPTLDESGQHRYPLYVRRTITIMSILMLVISFMPSAIRLHEIGRVTFLHAIQDAPSVTIAAWSIVLSAEIGQVIFSLAIAMAQNKWQKAALYVGAGISTLIALTGNAEAVKPHLYPGAFIWIETFAYPVLVLIASNVLKTQWLHAIEAKYEAQQQLDKDKRDTKQKNHDALMTWQGAYNAAHESPLWQRTVGNTLWEAIYHVNRQSKAVLRALTIDDKRALVLRELSADQWYERAESKAQAIAESERIERLAALKVEEDTKPATPVRIRKPRTLDKRIAASGSRTYELDNAVIQDGNTFTATCPKCAETFAGYDTHRSAMNALTSHTRKHRVAKANVQ